MWIEATNLLCRLKRATEEERSWLSEYLSFPEEKAFFRRRGKWRSDGKVRMLNEVTGTFPTGFLGAVIKAAKDDKVAVSVLDRRKRPAPEDPRALLDWLRWYQLEAVGEARKHERGIFHHATGAGKTEIMVALAELYPVNWLILTHRKSLLSQTADRFAQRTGEVVGMIGEGRARTQRVTVATFQTLFQALRRKATRQKLQPYLDSVQGVMVDECFPAGTLVGGVPIEEIKPGDFVPSYDVNTGAFVRRRVLGVSVSPAKPLVRVRFADGRDVVCTEGHPFYTDAGWLPAAAISGYCVLSSAHDTLPYWARVARVEILESRGVAGPGGLRAGDPVYNLHVEGTETYVVNGAVVHNCHVAAANTFWKVTMALQNAYYRYGFSGTPFARSDKKSIFIWGALGPAIHRVSAELLIKEGVLARPRVRMIEVRQPAVAHAGKVWTEVYQSAITQSDIRNTAVVAAAQRATKPCFLFVDGIAHGKELEKRLRAAGAPVEFVWGNANIKVRQAAVRRLVHGDTDVLICNVIFQEGLDVPELQSVVLAQGKKSKISVLQRLGRGTRRKDSKGTVTKTEFEVYDFVDLGCGKCGKTLGGVRGKKHSACKWLEQHSRARFKAYASEKFEVIREKPQLALPGVA